MASGWRAVFVGRGCMSSLHSTDLIRTPDSWMDRCDEQCLHSGPDYRTPNQAEDTYNLRTLSQQTGPLGA
jgi:hypothetical protein